MKRELYKSFETAEESFSGSESESEFDNKTDDPPSYQPDPNVRIVKIRSGRDGTLKRMNNEIEIPKYSEKFYQNNEMPVPKIINSEKTNTQKRQAPKVPPKG